MQQSTYCSFAKEKKMESKLKNTLTMYVRVEQIMVPTFY